MIWEQLLAGNDPANALSILASIDPGHQSRQYGIIDTQGRAVTFSGANNSAWAGGLTGSVGTIHWAVQGNILTGPEVVIAAVQAIENTPGDLAEKLMAGMEAAASFGGDGRCSCSPSQPTSCGAPPPSFTKSAHVGYMMIAREGDTEGTCSSTALGCASGDYWLTLNVPNQTAGAVDPVIQLRGLFDAWRLELVGRPDHYLSTVAANPTKLIPNGSATTQVTVSLVDAFGTPLTSGGATVTVAEDAATAVGLTIGAVTDHGDGSYSFPVTAGTATGIASLRIAVDDGVREVVLGPHPTIEVRADSLWADSATMSAANGGTINLLLDAGGGKAMRIYATAASASGTVPGIPLPAVTIPLNPDPWFDISLQFANTTFFGNTVGNLDLAGRAQATFSMPGGGFLAPVIGLDLDFAFFTLAPFDFASNPVRISIVP